MASYNYDAIGIFELRTNNLAHGFVEGKAKDLDKEVDGITGFVLLGPAPIGVFDKQAFEGGQFDVLSGQLKHLEAAFFEQRGQRRDAGGADLFSCPPGCGGRLQRLI